MIVKLLVAIGTVGILSAISIGSILAVGALQSDAVDFDTVETPLSLDLAPTLVITTSTTVTIESKRFPVGSTTKVSVMIDGLQNGLAGFDVTLEGATLGDTIPVGVGGLRASNLRMPQYGLTQVVATTTDRIKIRAADLFKQFEGTMGPFELFSFDLSGSKRGIPTIGLLNGAPLRLDDDFGTSLLPITSFTVGEYGVTELVRIDVKFVVILDTPRSETQIRDAMLGIQTLMKNKIDELLSTDSQTTRRPFEYRLKIIRTSPTRIEIYPKLLLVIDTTRSDLMVRIRVSSLFDYLKDEVRILVASDLQTTIESYHIHRHDGAYDEVEP